MLTGNVLDFFGLHNIQFKPLWFAIISFQFLLMLQSDYH